MNIKTWLAVLAGKITRGILRALGRGGTSLPGKVALKIQPNLLGFLSKDVTTVIVTGTNGKTTTSRMIERVMEEEGISFFCNKSGANLLFGITNEYIANVNLRGKAKRNYALIESDEAAFKEVSRYVDAKAVVVTNIFRDQLDRFGEITHTLNNVKTGIDRSPHATLCLNADCSMTASLGQGVDRKVIYFGVNVPIYKQAVREASDAPYCIRCKGEYTYDYITFGHLGKYRCDQCGYQRPPVDVGVNRVYESNADSSEIALDIQGNPYQARINLPGGYNIYNGIATMALVHAMGWMPAHGILALSDFQCGFGRMEALDLNGVPTRMILIKNPAGCNQVLNFLTNATEKSTFVIGLNDRYADGTDISWIWDADFEALNRLGDALDHIYIVGIRRDDMALRLKYAGVDLNKTTVIEDYDTLIDKMTQSKNPVYIMPTYTAMMDLRKILSKRFGLKNFWE